MSTRVAFVLAPVVLSMVSSGASGAAGKLPTWDGPHMVAEVPVINDGFGRIASADFNADGLQDLMQPTSNGEIRLTPITVQLNDGKGGYREATAKLLPGGVPKVIHPEGILVDDFNSDGRPDLFLCDFGQHGPNAVDFGFRDTLLLSTGRNKMRDATANLPEVPPGACHSAAAADIDADGDLDIYVGNECCGQGRPYLLQNDGRGRFTALLDRLPAEAVRQQIPSSAFADLDADGYPELLLGGNGGDDGSLDDSWLLRNDGTGNFTTFPDTMPNKTSAEAFVSHMSAIDLDGEGSLDVLVQSIVESPDSWDVQFLENDGSGLLRDTTGKHLKGAKGTRHLARFWLVDVDGDGTLDFFGIGWYPPILLNNGKGKLRSTPFDFEAMFPGLAPRDGFVLVDVDGDGGRDVVGAYYGPIDGIQYYAAYKQTDGPTPPSIPQRLLATKQLKRRVMVSWEYAWGATSYEVWRSEKPGEPGERIGASDRTWFKDGKATRGRSYVYTVRALNGAGISPHSSGVTGMAR